MDTIIEARYQPKILEMYWVVESLGSQIFLTYSSTERRCSGHLKLSGIATL